MAVSAIALAVAAQPTSLAAHPTSTDDACAPHNTCGGCLGEGTQACFWCHSSHSCKEWSIAHFGECGDIGLDAASCECRPAVYDECTQCANASHAGCVWLQEPDTKIELTIGKVTQTLDLGKSQTGICWNGGGFGPTGLQYNNTVDVLGVPLTLGVTTTPTTWFWGQCRLPENTMAGMLIAISLALCCCVTLCCHCARRRRRRAVLRQPLLTAFGPAGGVGGVNAPVQ